ncbi:Trk potassium uptake system protein TrkH [hydrothermal vent metagenome]|uniref:Trk potassium uptake system protein TrkH n=1 Tax=hydrothermal vent metagenome TaxID=652676 RepID=A0A3B0RTR6_9ZZZZ
MADLRPVILIIGAMISLLGIFMLAPMLADLMTGHANWRSFAISMVITLFTGIIMLVGTKGGQLRLSVRGAFFLTTASWVLLCLFAALPFLLIEQPLSLTDAIFEAVSGLTTTGSTILSGLDEMNRGILLWRALLQWIGGIGIVVTAMAVLPMLKIGGMQLFSSEWFDPLGKFLPRAGGIAIGLSLVYLALTLACGGIYWLLGMPPFDAMCYAMTTVATGGFTNSDSSFGLYATGGADIAASVFMFAGALPFAAFILALNGRVGTLFRDSQIKAFFMVVVIFTLIASLYIWWQGTVPPERVIRTALFNVISIVTGTGYALGDFQAWGPAMAGMFFLLMFIGGCAGSSSCSIKIFRFQVAAEGLRVYIRRMLHPKEVDVMVYNGHPLPASALYSVLGFIFVFFACFAALAIGLSLSGLEPITAISAAATSITNVGPGLGDIVGPSGNFSSLPDIAKWMMATGMIVGRLEIFTVLVLFTPRFWLS